MTTVRFGTDGIRGIAGETLTVEIAAALGVALIAATFVWPLGRAVYDKTHTGLSKVFNVQKPAAPDYGRYYQPEAQPEAAPAPTPQPK